MAEIKVLPNNGMAPNNECVAAHLREQADWMLEPDAKDVRNVVLLIEYTDGSLRRQPCGDPRLDLARMVGLLQIAAARAATGMPNPDDD